MIERLRNIKRPLVLLVNRPFFQNKRYISLTIFQDLQNKYNVNIGRVNQPKHGANNHYIAVAREDNNISTVATHGNHGTPPKIITDPNNVKIVSNYTFITDFFNFNNWLVDPTKKYLAQMAVYRYHFKFAFNQLSPYTINLLEKEPLEIWLIAFRMKLDNPQLFDHLNRRINKVWQNTNLTEEKQKAEVYKIINTVNKFYSSDYSYDTVTKKIVLLLGNS